jgi:CHAT domain-containing protein
MVVGCLADLGMSGLLSTSAPAAISSRVLYALHFQEGNFESYKEMPRIWWCPTGPLAFLPIHAAGIYHRNEGIPIQCLSDFAVSSYLPTVNALSKSPKLASVERRGDSSSSLLIVSQPNTPKKTPIPFAADETNRIAKQLENRRIPYTTLSNESGTVDGVLEAMESFPSIHLACHALQDTTNPIKSSIYLHDGPLELSEIMKKKLPDSDFAFLSACQTSTGDKDLPEEVVHFAAGMLGAGYQSVVGTMWSIMDEHGPDIAEFFYEGLLAGSSIEGAGAARALQYATQRFREMVSDTPDSHLVWVPYTHFGV